MRYIKLVLLSLSLFVGLGIISSCLGKKKMTISACKGDCITVQGTLQQQGMTTYQYGTHTITAEDGKTYVLKSDVLDLKKYEGKKVRLTAQNLQYTVENGPELHNVVAIKEIQ